MHKRIEKFDARKWHRWFAWHPVETRDGYKVWWEWIWRQLEYSTYDVWPHYSLEKPQDPPSGIDESTKVMGWSSYTYHETNSM